MKVTIITPTYNSAETLRENLLSVHNQSYANIEHLIIDNQSRDATMNIVREFDHNIKVVSEPDNGIYDAMNKGIKMATGDIIGILNSDDYLSDRETIAQIVSTFLRDDCDAVYGNLIYVNKEDPYKIQRIWEAGSYSKRQLLHGWMLPHPTLYLKKNMYEKYGLYKSDFKYSADYEMIVRLLLKFTIKASNLKKVIVYMRAGGASNKNIFARLAVNNEDRQAWDSLGIQPKWYTLYMKPMRKIIQYFHKYFSVKWLIHIPPAYNEDSYLWTVYREGCTLKFNRMFFSKKNSRSVSYEFLGADMHNHVLPGIDDGAPDVAASLKLLKMLFEIGFKKVIPTPHRASNLYPNDPCTIQKAWDTIASRLKTDPIGYPDILKFGAEYMLDGDFCSLRKTNRLMTFANNRVLIEMSYAAASPILLDEIYELQMAGYKPILAHPERYSYISGNYSYLENLVRRGCELQLNLLSLTDCHGRLAQKTALKLLDMELYHWAGTDVHNEVHINFLKELLQSRYVELLIEYPFQNKLLLQY